MGAVQRGDDSRHQVGAGAWGDPADRPAQPGAGAAGEVVSFTRSAGGGRGPRPRVRWGELTGPAPTFDQLYPSRTLKRLATAG